MTKLKLAVIGAGHLGRIHARLLSQMNDVELLGIASDYYATHTEKTKLVTPELANEAVRRRISTEDLTIVVVGTASMVAGDIEKAVPNIASMEIVPFDRD